jgi:hypothetical protein
MEVSKGLRYYSGGGGVYVRLNGRHFALIQETSHSGRYFIACRRLDMPAAVEVSESEVEPFIEWLASL